MPRNWGSAGLLVNKALYHDAAMFKKIQLVPDLGDKIKLWGDVWTQVKTN